MYLRDMYVPCSRRIARVENPSVSRDIDNTTVVHRLTGVSSDLQLPWSHRLELSRLSSHILPRTGSREVLCSVAHMEQGTMSKGMK